MLTKIMLLLTLSCTLLLWGVPENNNSKQAIIQKQIEKQKALEKKYAKEQRFYQGDEYDFKSKEVDPDILKDVKPLEPDYEHTNEWGAADNE